MIEKSKMTNTEDITPKFTEEGLRITLAAILKAQRRFSDGKSRYYTPGVISIFLEKGIDSPKDNKHIAYCLYEAERRGYIEECSLHTRIEDRETLYFGFRVKAEKLSEIERMVQ